MKTLPRMRTTFESLDSPVHSKMFRHLNEIRAPYQHHERSLDEPNQEEKLHFTTAKFPAKQARSSRPSQIQSCFHKALNESDFQKCRPCAFPCQLHSKTNQRLISFFPQQNAFNISLALENFAANWHSTRTL